MIKKTSFILATLLLSSAALAQDPDAGKPGHVGGSWGETLPQHPLKYEEETQKLHDDTVYVPGCTPKADTPQSLLDYFKKFKQPLPKAYCEEEAPPQQQAQEPPQEPKQFQERVPQESTEAEAPPPQENAQSEAPPPQEIPGDRWQNETPPEIPEVQQNPSPPLNDIPDVPPQVTPVPPPPPLPPVPYGQYPCSYPDCPGNPEVGEYLAKRQQWEGGGQGWYGSAGPNGINVQAPFFQLHIRPWRGEWRRHWRHERRQWRRYG